LLEALKNEKSIAQLLSLFPRAAKVGYNGVLLNGINGFDRSASYAEAVTKAQTAATMYGLEIIPCVLMHNSSSLVYQDPNIAEGLPVKDALFVVNGREAKLQPDPAIEITNGGFEEAVGNKFTDWGQDEPNLTTFFDQAVAHSGKASARVENLYQGTYWRARFFRQISVKPFRQYRISAWVKTEDFDGYPYMLVIAPTEKQRDIGGSQWSLGIEDTQAWKQYHIIVNSLNYDSIHLFMGAIGEKEGKGRLWWDDVTIEEIGLHNVLRRNGTPVTVRGEDGAIYEEGRDYERVVDPKLAAEPTIHDPIPLHLTQDSRIPDGAHLRISYYHPSDVGGYLVACLSEPKTYELLQKDLEGINTMLHPTTFFMYDDEVRIANWDESCLKRNLTPGQQLAEKVRWSVAAIRELNPEADIWDWSDMFCPLENATDDICLVNGSWAESWEGLEPSVGIANWGNHLEGKNLKWFADRGHRQLLAGYYDGGGYPIQKWLKAGEGLSGIVGAMYTTWIDKYDDLEIFALEAWNGGIESRQNNH
jgi:hypothetical protein